MGNTQSEVTAGAKKQADFDPTTTKIYSLLDVKKGGLLVALMRDAFRRRDFRGVDDKIREMVMPFLYNNGEGKMIPVSKIVRMRNKERPASKRLPSVNEKDDDESNILENSDGFMSWISAMCGSKKRSQVSSTSSSEQETMKEVCWKLSERGSVGETGLHLCFLVATVVHMELGRRLVRIFPKLVNDVYASDEYYGEGALHMAVVNEDPSMVKFLLNNGADVHERATGNFFCADDQKDARVDNLKHEHFDLPIMTNYAGHVYWGEFSLSFAACLEQEDCYRLLLAKGADPDRQDTNGNTVIHMCVILNKMNMFDLAYTLGGDVSVRNRQGLTPLSLAARLTKSEMFFHIMNLTRHVYWQLAKIAFAAYPLDVIDSIDVNTGEINTTAALTEIAFGEELGHLDLINGVIVELLKEKWEKFARKQFFAMIKTFSVYFLISLIAFTIRPPTLIPPDQEPKQVNVCRAKSIANSSHQDASNVSQIAPMKFICWGNDCSRNVVKRTPADMTPHVNDANITVTKTKNETNGSESLDHCYLLRLETNMEKVQRIFDLLILTGASLYVISFAGEMKRLGFHMFVQTWSSVPGRVLFAVSCLLVMASVPLRFMCWPRMEDKLIAVAMFLTPMHFLFFCRGFKAVGPFVIMIYKMIVSDLLCFGLIYLMFVLGFAQAFFVIFRTHKDPSSNIFFSGVIDSVMTMFLMSINDFGDVYKEFDNTDHPILCKFLFLAYMIVVAVLLVNMLIAMMGHTYEDIASRPNEWLRQWARIVLIVERGLQKEERLNYQEKYSEYRNGSRVFIVKWETSVSPAVPAPDSSGSHTNDLKQNEV